MRAAAVVAGHGFVVLVPEIYHDIVQEGWVGQYDTAGADRGNELKITKTIESYDSGAFPIFCITRAECPFLVYLSQFA